MKILNINEILNLAKKSQEDFQFQAILQIKDHTIKKTTAGNPYFILNLGDITNNISNFKKWINTPEELDYYSEIFEFGNILEIIGEFQKRYNSITIKTVKKLNPDEFDLNNFIGLPQLDKEKLCNTLFNTISNIYNNFLKELLDNIFFDTEIKSRYLECPSSIIHHHPYRCGNLEHTIGMITIFNNLKDFYEQDTILDIDLIYTGIILHDIGKIYEYEINNGIPYHNKDFALLNHINLGDQIVLEHIKKIENFPHDLENRIRHIILSHHGRKEWGSPLEPQFPEAEIIHYLDMIDSRFKSSF